MSSRMVAPSREVQDEARRRAEGIAAGLFAHQVEGVAFLLGRRRAILADDMGLGKTRQSIVALTEAAPTGPYLVICPASVKQNWRREILAARPDANVLIVDAKRVPDKTWTGWVILNYDILGRHQEALTELPWSGIVFDEAHYLKNHGSIRSRLARKLAESAGPDVIVHALTGTPLTNRPRDLFALLQLTRHPMAKSFLSFAKRYCAAYHNGYGWVTDGASNLDELRTELHGLMLRRTKDDVLDLPPKVRTWLEVDVPDGTARHEARKVLELLIQLSVRGEEGASLRKTRYNPPAQTQLLSVITTARRKLATAKVKHTIDLAQSAVDQDEKVIVFSSFEEPLQRIRDHFGNAALLLTGKTPVARRQRIVDQFQNDSEVRVLVANLIAGGVGVNLTAARQVIFNDLDWVPANHWQAEDRAYRIGQTGTVNVSYLVAGGTLDAFVASTLAAKTLLIDAMVEGTDLEKSDVLSSLASQVRAFSPQLSNPADGEIAEDPVDRLLREVSAKFNAGDANPLKGRPELSADAIAKLAAALVGPVAARYRLESSKRPGVFYELEVDGTDVVCNCPGFEYRGHCSHSRTLKAALTAGQSPPDGYRALVP